MQKKLHALLRPIVEECGLELWGVRFDACSGKARLCVFIDSSAGVSLEDCSRVSHEIKGILEVEEAVAKDCTLEVSSPGIERVFFHPHQYRNYVGERIRIKLVVQTNGRRNIAGVLKQWKEDGLVIQQEGDVFAVPFGHISHAQLERPCCGKKD